MGRGREGHMVVRCRPQRLGLSSVCLGPGRLESAGGPGPPGRLVTRSRVGDGAEGASPVATRGVVPKESSTTTLLPRVSPRPTRRTEQGRDREGVKDPGEGHLHRGLVHGDPDRRTVVGPVCPYLLERGLGCRTQRQVPGLG